MVMNLYVQHRLPFADDQLTKWRVELYFNQCRCHCF